MVCRIYIELPEEDSTPGMVGRLTKSMYGTQDAPNIWQQHYTQLLVKAGHIKGEWFSILPSNTGSESACAWR